MAIIKKGENYILDIRIDGKRIRRSLGTDNYMLALDKAKDLKDQLNQEYDRSSIKFADFCKQYMDWAWSSKPASALREEQRLEKIKSFFEDLDIVTLSEITPFHVEKLKSHLKETEISEGKKMSKATINRYLQLLRGMFYRAIDWEIYEGKNPVKKVRFYQERSPAHPCLRMK